MTTETDTHPAVARPGNVVGVPPLLPRILVLSLVFIALFTGCWVGAFHQSVPHGVPIGIAGNASLATDPAVTVNHYSDDASLRQAVEHGTVAGGVSFNSGQATIWVGEAQGKQTVTFATTYLAGVAAHDGDHATVRTLALFAPGDASGVVPFFVALSLLVPSLIAGAMIGASKTLRRPTRITLLAAFSVLACLLDWLIASQWLGAMTGGSAGYAAVVLLYALAVSATAAALTALARPLVAVAGALFLGFGVPTTGGPAALGYFIPVFYQHLQLYLPPSEAVYGIRSAEWFGGSGVPTACLALGAWSLAGFAVLLVKPALPQKLITHDHTAG